MPALKVKIIRKTNVEPVTLVTYTSEDKPDAFSHWAPDLKTNDFEVEPELALAAVETGAFEVVPESGMKPKGKGKGE